MGKDARPHWHENADAIAIVTSATAAIRGVLRLGLDVCEEHKKSLISRMLWKITEANGKYNTRYYSEKALKADNSNRRHDHVWTRKGMIERVLEKPDNLKHEVQRAIGCIVTRSEHETLASFDAQSDGWDRYKKAKIKVWHLKEQRRISDDWQ